MTEPINEDIILNKIYNASAILLTLLHQIKDAKRDIKTDIERLDNNYFVEKTDALERFNEILDDQGIDQLTNIVDKLYEEVKDELTTKCSEHEFIEDSADIGFDKVLNFSYCRHCHLSKKV